MIPIAFAAAVSGLIVEGLTPAKFLMSKREPEQEARKVAQAIANEIGKFMTVQGIPTLKSSGPR